MKLRRIITVILCFVMLLQVPVMAQAAENTSADEYIIFTGGKERMKDDGTFDFSFNAEKTSQHFITNKTSITISSQCRRYNNKTGENIPTTSCGYTLTLYKMGSSEAVGSYTGYANDKKASATFEVEKGEEYYFVMTSNKTLGATYRLRGTGKVTNVTPV